MHVSFQIFFSQVYISNEMYAETHTGLQKKVQTIVARF